MVVGGLSFVQLQSGRGCFQPATALACSGVLHPVLWTVLKHPQTWPHPQLLLTKLCWLHADLETNTTPGRCDPTQLPALAQRRSQLELPSLGNSDNSVQLSSIKVLPLPTR